MERESVEQRIAEATRLGGRGQLPEAETVLRELLMEVRGVDQREECNVLRLLAVVYGAGGRTFEASVLAEAAVDVARKRGDDQLLAQCLGPLCGALFTLRLADALPPLLRELRDVLARLPEEQIPSNGREYYGGLLGYAILTRNVEAARRHLVDFEAAFRPEAERDPTAMAVMHTYRAQIHLYAGDPDAALEALSKTEELAVDRPNIALQLAVLWVEFLGAAGRDADAVARGREALRMLEEMVVLPFTCSDRLEHGRTLAKHLDDLGATEEAHRAYDIVAAAVLEHIAQLDACAKSLPELGLGSDAQLAQVVEARKRFVEEQHEILKRVAALLERDEGGIARVLAHDSDGYVRICAWCERLRPQDGAWLPLGQFVPRGGPLRITHSICPACSAAMLV